MGPPQARAPRDSAACCGCSRKTATGTLATDGINGILARWPVYALVAAVVIESELLRTSGARRMLDLRQAAAYQDEARPFRPSCGL
jgi:hypothetical protein